MMLKAAAAMAVSFMLVSATPMQPPISERYNSRASFALPPARFTSDNSALVIFATDVSKYCGQAPEGLTILGCHRMTVDGVPVLVLPNPNRTILTPAGYQRLVAHELGHRNGWGGNHEL